MMPEIEPIRLAGHTASGKILACSEGLSFWGGVDPDSGRIIDTHHPNHGQSVAGKVVLMPTSRGSCSGSGVLLQLALNNCAPAALIFREDEEILTLGALVADRIFGKPLVVLRLPPDIYDQIGQCHTAEITAKTLKTETLNIPFIQPGTGALQLTKDDKTLLNSDAGHPAQVAMDILCRMAIAQGATNLIDVTRGHIDGCILAHDANLIFAEKLADMGARVAIPTTINAISVDRKNWRTQNVDPNFGTRASRLADAYVTMGARPTFTCAPYLMPDPPKLGECIGWSESNAVIFANSVLGARTAKHPDYLDLCIAVTGRTPNTGLYTDAGRRARRILNVALPSNADEAIWPLLGWCAGQASPDRIPLLRGLENAKPTQYDLKALCAAFGTTSGAPMLHISGYTPEADMPPSPDADTDDITAADLRKAWSRFNTASDTIDLVAIGSPHASLEELRRLARLMEGRAPKTNLIVTVGRGILNIARTDPTIAAMEAAGTKLLPDLCWCSITKPIFPPEAKTVMTTSGKFAHYAPGLTGRAVRFGTLADCANAALTGQAPPPPDWVQS